MHLRTPLTAALLVATVSLGACGSDETASTTPTSSPGTGDLPAECVDIAEYQWYGASKEEAVGRAEAEGRPWRVAREDDETFALTEDYVVGRVTFQIDEGTVTYAVVELDEGPSREGAADPDDSGFMGLTRAEAEAQATAADIPWRTVRVGDESFPVTLDYREDRRNFEIDGEPPCDVVTVITRG